MLPTVATVLPTVVTVLPTVAPKQKTKAVTSVAVLKFDANQKALIPFHRTAIDHPVDENECYIVMLIRTA